MAEVKIPSRLLRKHPEFLELLCKAIEKQQAEKPKSPDDLRKIVMEKHRKRLEERYGSDQR